MNYSSIKFRLLKFVSVTIFLAISSTAISQINSNAKEVERHEAVVLSNTQIHRLHSKFTNADYKIYINLPASYFDNKREKSYPTLYLLDADYSFALAKQIGEHLMDRNRIKEFIIVGIAYDGPLKYKLNRTRDYTPSKVLDGGYGPEYQQYSGGADQFHQFIKNELIPYINARFSTNNDRTIVGHSYGGLFASYGLIKYPETFNNAIIVSPSLWYDKELVIKQALARPNFNYSNLHKIYFAVGENENGGNYKMVDELTEFTKIIASKPHQNLVLKNDIPNELDHDTIFPAALTKGLMFILN